MAVGNTHSCALLKDGRVDCWGNNDFGQLGTGNWTSTPVPMAVPELDGGVCQNICGFLCVRFVSHLQWTFRLEGSPGPPSPRPYPVHAPLQPLLHARLPREGSYARQHIFQQ
jgi:hypothetical protein